MADYPPPSGPEHPSEEELDRILTELGPVMLFQEQAETEGPDPDFARSLRARLVGDENSRASTTPTPDPTAPGAGSRPISLERERRRRRPPLFAAALASAMIVAALVALVLNSRSAHSPGTRPVALFSVPTPDATQLTAGYPFPQGLGGGGGEIPPWHDLQELPPGDVHHGRLQLSAGPLPFGPARLPAYRLQSPAVIAARLEGIARQLGIHGSIRRSSQPDGTWVYAQNLDPVRHTNLVSVAVNLSTGELIYHDLHNFGRASGPPANGPAYQTAARVWLTSLGWPGATMPRFIPPAGQEFGFTQTVALGWSGAGITDVPAAHLFVGVDRKIMDADVWPPVAAETAVPAQGYPAAWTAIRAGKIPIGLAGADQFPTRDGSGMLNRRAVLQVFTPALGGTLFLVPTYRFSGTVQLRNAPGTYPWVAVVSATR